MISSRPKTAAPAAASSVIIRRMAEKLIELDRIDCGVSDTDLKPFFTKAEIEKYGEEAVAFALNARQAA